MVALSNWCPLSDCRMLGKMPCPDLQKVRRGDEGSTAACQCALIYLLLRLLLLYLTLKYGLAVSTHHGNVFRYSPYRHIDATRRLSCLSTWPRTIVPILDLSPNGLREQKYLSLTNMYKGIEVLLMHLVQRFYGGVCRVFRCWTCLANDSKYEALALASSRSASASCPPARRSASDSLNRHRAYFAGWVSLWIELITVASLRWWPEMNREISVSTKRYATRILPARHWSSQRSINIPLY